MVYRPRAWVLLAVGQSVCLLPAQDLLETEMSATYLHCRLWESLLADGDSLSFLSYTF